jgi:hypothetical protein
VIQIKLGAERAIDPNTDPLGRTRVGYWPGMSEDEAWESGRASWRLRATAALDETDIQIIGPGPEYLVLARATLTGLTKDPHHPPRFTIEGTVIPGHPAVGRPSPNPHPSQNSVRYVAN